MLNIECLHCFRYYTYEKIESIANWIKERVSIEPQVAIVCGSGLGHIADSVNNAQKIAYEEIPEFPRSTGKCCLLFISPYQQTLNDS